MLNPEWAMATGVIIIAGFSIGTYTKVGKVAQDAEDKRGRIYERVDEVKQANKDEFVAQAVCDVKYDGVTKKLDEIACDVKKILTNGNGKKQ